VARAQVRPTDHEPAFSPHRPRNIVDRRSFVGSDNKTVNDAAKADRSIWRVISQMLKQH
jgi:hypothetical protein